MSMSQRDNEHVATQLQSIVSYISDRSPGEPAKGIEFLLTTSLGILAAFLGLSWDIARLTRVTDGICKRLIAEKETGRRWEP